MKIRYCYAFSFFEEPDCEDYGDERGFPCHINAYGSEVSLASYPVHRFHKKGIGQKAGKGIQKKKKGVVNNGKRTGQVAGYYKTVAGRDRLPLSSLQPCTLSIKISRIM